MRKNIVFFAGPDQNFLNALGLAISKLQLNVCVHRNLKEHKITCCTRNTFVMNLPSKADIPIKTKHRQIHFVSVTTDPRKLVLRSGPIQQPQPYYGFDFSLELTEAGWYSFTGPGVLHRIKEIESVKKSQLFTTVTTVTSESFQHNFFSAMATILKEIGVDFFTRRNIPTPVIESSALSAKEAISRLRTQLSRCPELESVAQNLGYPPCTPPQPLERNEFGGRIISFYSPDKIYRAEAARLQSSCLRVGVDFALSEIHPETNWVRTTLRKPDWILSARESYSGPLLYLDADAILLGDPWPLLQEFDCDVACPISANGEIRSGTILVNDSPGALRFLREWQSRCHVNLEKSDKALSDEAANGDGPLFQELLMENLNRPIPDYRIMALPLTMGKIFDFDDQLFGNEALIVHLQASRERAAGSPWLERRHAAIRKYTINPSTEYR